MAAQRARPRPLRFLDGTRGRRSLPPLVRACLVVVDVQRLFADPSSPAFVAGWKGCEPSARSLIAAFRRRRLPVVRTRHALREGDAPGAMGMFWDRVQSASDPMSAPDPSVASWCDGTPLATKRRMSALTTSSVARAAAAEGTLVIMGLQTHLCILATALDAARRDLRPVVVADACAARERSLHRDALRVLSSGHAHVATADEVIAALASGGRAA